MKRIFVALVLICASSAAFAAANFATEPPKTNDFVDTGWYCTDNKTSHKVLMKHGLGATPRIFSLVFAESQDASVVYPITWPWDHDYSGNPVTISLSTESLTLNIFNGVPLHGVWDPNTGQWSKFTTGCFRAFLIK